jgi:methionyl-tRNA synthetase
MGNFANRVLVLMQKYYQGVMPTVDAVQANYRLFERSGVVGGKHPMVEEYIAPVVKLLNHYQFRDAQFKVMELARLGNKYLAEHEPWKLVKTDANGTAQVLSEAVHVLYNMAMLMEPFMPEASGRLLKQLQVNPDASQRKNFWMAGEGAPGVWFELLAGHALGEGGLLFQKIEDDVIESQIAKLRATGAANASVSEGSDVS